ncbi:MAG: sulfite exporter TauE/SafE family protein [Haloarculaceae archaeon]
MIDPGSVAGPPVLALFLVGVLGGAHCLGMCGPLVTLYAEQMPGDDRGPTWFDLRQHALFNAGRTVSYATIGAGLGALGSLVFGAAGLATVGDFVRATTGVAVGLVVVSVGLAYLVRGRTGFLPHVGGGSGAFARVYGALSARVAAWTGDGRIVGLGLLHGLLPCPLLYPAFLYAFGTGSAVAGGVGLAALGVGTFPTLFAYGVALGSLDAGTRTTLHRALGVAFVVLGTIPLAHGLNLFGIPVPHIPLPMPSYP